jgi:hypothetical protein
MILVGLATNAYSRKKACKLIRSGAWYRYILSDAQHNPPAGLSTDQLDGRVLGEALARGKAPSELVETHTLHAAHDVEGTRSRQYLTISRIGNHVYFGIREQPWGERLVLVAADRLGTRGRPSKIQRGRIRRPDGKAGRTLRAHSLADGAASSANLETRCRCSVARTDISRDGDGQPVECQTEAALTQPLPSEGRGVENDGTWDGSH